jgi:hypothetical protein
MAKRFAVPGVLCLAACGDYNLVEKDPDGGDNGNGKCAAIEVTPTSIDFGDDFDIVAGTEPRTETVEVKNVGEAPLHILDLYLAQGEPSYDVSQMSSLVLNVGATAQFTVTFDPKQPFEHPEQILIDSDDCDTPTAAVAVNGVGLAPQIEIDPVTVDFGYLDVGCETNQLITISNVGNAPLILPTAPSFMPSDPDDLIYFAGSDPEDPKSALVFPLEIIAGESAQVTITYAPLDETDDNGVLTVTSNDPYQPTVHAEQTGGILGTEEAEDLFEQPAKPMTDIAFIVDNSCSMAEEQANLANNFEYFIYKLQSSSADYQIGVITTDQNGFRGEVITPDTLNAVEKFTDQAVAGTGGSGTERALQMLYNCVQPGGDCSEDAGFMRDDALFAGIIVSDEPDQSALSPEGYVEYFWTLKDDPDLIKIHAIAGNIPVPTCGSCASAGFGYDEAVEATEGTFLDVCTDDWGASLSALAESSIQDLSLFKLSQDPVEDTIEVFVDDAQRYNGWWYTGHEEDLGNNAVRFQDEYIPEGGSEVRIEYVVRQTCEG